MKIIVAGTRTVSDYSIVEAAIEASGLDITMVISGDAPGVDRLGVEWAKRNGCDFARVPANWDRYRKRAGHIRNVDMEKQADGLIAIWDGKSNGTKDMIDVIYEANKKRKQRKQYKPLFIYSIPYDF